MRRPSEKYVFANGEAEIHAAKVCLPPCPMHWPTVHHMSRWPLFAEPNGVLYRMCACGTLHPDPDNATFLRSVGNPDLRDLPNMHLCCPYHHCATKGI